MWSWRPSLSGRRRSLVPATAALSLLLATFPAMAQTAVPEGMLPAPDRSGEIRRGEASVFAGSLAGRRMANGARFDPQSNSVASSDLPLGATARVTNLRNRRSTIVAVRDRFPRRGDRILNVSPMVARQLGMRGTSVIRVEVAPLAVPQADGGIRIGQGSGLSGRKAYVTPVR